MIKILSILLVLAGLLGGMAAGYMLRPAPEVTEAEEEAEDDLEVAALTAPPVDGFDVVKLPDQFVIPLLNGGRVEAMMVLNLSLELGPEAEARLDRLEPRLRDRFLQVLFDHANSGGFDGAFTSNTAMSTLRSGLREAARDVLGSDVAGVLITDLFRRDV